MATNDKRRQNMSTQVVSPQVITSNADDAGISKLTELQARIAALRVQSQATQNDGAKRPLFGHLPMSNVFNPLIKPPEGLSADRDATKRDERIMTLLRERGALRVLGAVASPVLADAIGQLYDSHANFNAAVDYVLGEEVLARQQGNALCGLRLLLHGGAGVGKTDFALSLAKLLAVPGEVISLSSAQAAAALAGSEQYWSNTQPGAIWKQLIQGTHANPLFVLDELDKTTTQWGDPLGALYQLLEARTASIFCDKSVPWLPVDASRINWIATANDPEALHPAIRSRFVEIEVTSPTEGALRQLVQRLYSNLLSEFDLMDRFPKELTVVQTTALLGGSIRDAKRILRAALGQALRDNSKELTLKMGTRQNITRQRIGFL